MRKIPSVRRSARYYNSFPSVSAALEDTMLLMGVQPKFYPDAMQIAEEREIADRFDTKKELEKALKARMAMYEHLTDVQLVRWATNFGGWTYFYCNDQLKDPQGGMTTAQNWTKIGSGRRNEILEQMARGCNPKQLEFIQIKK